MENERSMQQPDQVRLQSLYSLKNILSTGDLFERGLLYAKLVDGVVLKTNIDSSSALKRIMSTIEPLMRREEDILQLVDEFKLHIEKVEQLTEGRKLDHSVNQVALRRIELEKLTVGVLEAFSGAIRSIVSAHQNFRLMSDNRLDMMDSEQIDLIEQTYAAAFFELDRVRQLCVDSGKKYSTSPVLSKLFNSISDFCIILFTELMISPSDLLVGIQILKEYNRQFHPLQKIYDQVKNDIDNTKNEGSISRNIQDFNIIFTRLGEEYNKMTSNGVESVTRLFVSHNMEELQDGFDFIMMVKETFSVFSKILDERVRVGHASPDVYQELDNVLSDKPDVVVSMGGKFRNTFS